MGVTGNPRDELRGLRCLRCVSVLCVPIRHISAECSFLIQLLFLVDKSYRSDQSLSRVRLFATPWIAARQASLSITSSRSSPKLISCDPIKCVSVWVYVQTHSTYMLAFTEKKFQKVRHHDVEIDIMMMRGVLCGIFLFSASYSWINYVFISYHKNSEVYIISNLM